MDLDYQAAIVDAYRRTDPVVILAAVSPVNFFSAYLADAAIQGIPRLGLVHFYHQAAIVDGYAGLFSAVILFIFSPIYLFTVDGADIVIHAVGKDVAGFVDFNYCVVFIDCD
ncbi:hypothetical protein D3C80_1548690 [compost metagenome]